MGLSSFFKRSPGGTPSDTPPPQSGGRGRQDSPGGDDEVQRARARARHRLIGAVVLLGIGIVGFPLVFETQPRPIPVDIPIEIPRKEGAPPLTIAPPRGAPAAVPLTPGDDVVTETKDDAAGREVPRAAEAAPRPASTPKPATVPPKRADAGDGARAQALLEGKAPAAAGSAAAARFIVQVGAFADAAAAQDLRVKVEKLGLKTYTQVASTAAGGRIRVRVGPFASRDEADRALAKARGAGLSAVVITL